jgi:hypothetical protein
MSWGENVYDSPANYGLTIVGDVEWEYGSYEFDMTVVFRDTSGNLYIGDDAGCSCPSPFEDHTSIADLEKVAGVNELKAALEARWENSYSKRSEAMLEIVDIIARVVG